MWLSDLSIRRPVFATVISLLLVAFGVLSFQRLPLRELPDIDPPIVTIDTRYPGASASVIESQVTQILEDQLSGLEGIRSIESQSRPGRSDITIEFNLSRDIEAAANDVRNAVSRVQDRLPTEIDSPEISKVDGESSPVIWFNMNSTTLDQFGMTEFAERAIVDRLSVLDGVAFIRFGGRKRYSMRIFPSPTALAARGLTVTDIEAALRRENVELPAGSLESDDQDLGLRIERSYTSAEDFRTLVIAEGSDGHLVRLGDVATVELGAEESRSSFRGNRIPQLSIGVVKQSQANTLAVATAARAEIEKVKKNLPPGTEIVISVDNSVFISQAISEVYRTLLIAMGLVIAVIFLFLGSARAALIPAVTVPVSITAAFIALAWFGLSINLLTLLALVLAIGLVVDDAIVVLENVQRRVDLGEPPLLAAQNGARQVSFAVIATTIVLVAVFTPIAFLQDAVGRLFAELAIALAAAVVVSGFVALTLSPMMCSKLLKPRRSEGRWSKMLSSALDRATSAYIATVRSALAHRGLVLAGFLAVIAGAYAMYASIPSELAPKEDRGIFFARIMTPPGSSYAYTHEQMLKVEDALMPMVEDGPLRRVLIRTPGFGAQNVFNTGFAFGVMEDWDKRDISGDAVVNDVRRTLGEIPSVRASVVMRQALGGRRGRPVEFVLQGPDYDQLAAWRDVVIERAEEDGILVSAQSDYEETRPEARLGVDRNRAASLGVSVAEVGTTLQALYGQKRIGRFNFEGEERDIILQAVGTERRELQDLETTYVRSRSGELIPLSNLISFERGATSDNLARFNRLRAITISAELAPGVPLGEAIDYLEGLVRNELPASAQHALKGQAADFRDAQSSFVGTFGLALLVVFLVLAGQFESFRHPLIVMLTVPLAVAGALFGLLMSDGTLNIYSQVGIIILIGIAAKNGILLIEFANQLRDQGRDVQEAILEAAATRFRPIVMTGVSTAIGALPLVLAAGPGAAARTTIGIVVFSGVLFATVLTLIVIPVVYDLLARGTRSPGTIAKRLSELESKGAQPAE